MYITISSDGHFVDSRPSRQSKGHSLTKVVSDYTVIDIETTGLDPSFCEIIELAAIRFRGGKPVNSFSSLVRPSEPLDDFITDLTGITNDMLSDAPDIKAALPRFAEFIGQDVLVGHNVNFDINFLYDNFLSYLDRPLSNDFIDTMRLARRLFPDLGHYKLVSLVIFFHIQHDQAHRALSDCEATGAVYAHIVQYVNENSLDLSAIFSKRRYDTKAADISATVDSFDEDHPLFGKVCVFTGALERMVRRDAMQIVVNLGGICGDNVTAKTNYLILGNNDYCATIKGGKSSKQKKAEALILKGKDLSIISENVFYDMISDYEGGD